MEIKPEGRKREREETNKQKETERERCRDIQRCDWRGRDK